MTMLIDSHAHLEMREFDADRNQVIDRALRVGVDLIVTIGTSLADSRKAAEIASRYPCVYAAIGVHPHEVKDIDPHTYDSLNKLATHDKVIAFGEIGLDFFRNLSPRDIQLKRFSEQLEIAHELNLPIIVHDRDAHKETLDLLRKWPGERKGVIHCFSGDYKMAQECIDMGFYISVTGAVTFKKSEVISEVVRKIPLERILIETDAPFITPEPHRGKRNEPSYVIFTARKIAELKGVTMEEVGRITSKNTRQIFGIESNVAEKGM